MLCLDEERIKSMKAMGECIENHVEHLSESTREAMQHLHE